MDRNKAVELLNNYVKSPHIMKHSYAVESVMRKLAERLAPGEEDLWGTAGLLHDLDSDIIDVEKEMHLHAIKAVEILRAEGYGTEEMYQAIIAHNTDNGSVIKNNFDRALYAADPITGFITAIALVYPDKKVASVKVKSVTKRMRETRFAAGANREAMKSIELLSIPFDEFVELSLTAMTEISDVLEL